MANKINCLHYRVVLLGSPGVGKTSILNRFLFKKFEPKHKPTVEDLFTQTFELGCIDLEVNFLDTSGSMQFPAMRRLNITNGDAFLLVYALDDESSLEVLKMSMNEIQEIRQDYQEIPIVFAGNKCDIPRESRKVLKETVSQYVHYELPRLRAKVVECSCKDNYNIENIFRAYLSLARVNLTSALPPKNNSNQQQQNKQHFQKRQGSTSSGNSHSTLTPSTPPPNWNKQFELIQHQQQTTTPPTSATNPIQQQQQQHTGSFKESRQQQAVVCSAAQTRRTSSMKLGLGFRKNNQNNNKDYDSSMLIHGMSNCNLNKRSNNNRNDPSVNDNNNNNNHDYDDNDQTSASTTSGNNDQQSQLASHEEKADQLEGEVNLDTAVRWRLSAEQNARAKPRSRSLIWRPSRKSRSNSNSGPNEAPNCQVS